MGIERGMVNHALAFARRGWKVIPIHSCDGTFIGKEPLTDNGFKDASSNEVPINYWWSLYPTANIGIKTGAGSGLIVVDIDKKNDGPASMQLLQEFYGRLPKTVTVDSGGGGVHYYFSHPGFEVRGRIGMRPGIDVKADGGGIVAPPSNHFSGRNYQFREGLDPDSVSLAPLPDWLLHQIRTKSNARHKTKSESTVILQDEPSPFTEPSSVMDIDDLQQVRSKYPWLRLKE